MGSWATKWQAVCYLIQRNPECKGPAKIFLCIEKIATTRTNSSHISTLDVTGLHERDCFRLTMPKRKL